MPVPRLTGSVDRGAGVFVQLRDGAGDFVGEVRADDDGRFTFYAIAGHWRVICLFPGGLRVERDVDMDNTDVDIRVAS